MVDDSEFAARTLNNWLWVTFTRSDPATDVHGVGRVRAPEALGLRGPLVIDARLKPHMPPPLEEDPAVTKRVDGCSPAAARWQEWNEPNPVGIAPPRQLSWCAGLITGAVK